MADETWGWAGSVREFLALPPQRWLHSLGAHHERLWGVPPAWSQRSAWEDEFAVLAEALRACLLLDSDAVGAWSVVFEYELPMEGGRRPDVVLLAGRSLVVIEFKSSGLPTQADIDQTAAYQRDLSDYHAESQALPSVAVLVLTGAAPGFARVIDGITVVAPDVLDRYLADAHSDGSVDLTAWLGSAYRPLPTLVEAARRIFRDEPLPHVHSAVAAGIPETVELLGEIIDAAAASGTRELAFVTGVPGAGKTLVGLRLVYERTATHGRATFLSGNGPLVQVLQDALQSRVFVRDLHAFIKTYALSQRQRVPEEHVVVFDEAQRAWDANYMLAKKRVAKSEPALLLEIGESIDGWSALVGLVGEGQEIHSGEEGGLEQWRDAAATSELDRSWTIHCPPRLAASFEGLEVRVHAQLDLDVSLRSRRAEQLHHWVRLLLEGSLPLAARQAIRIQQAHYPIYLTRDLNEARDYVRGRLAEEPSKRTGLLASSHAKRLPAHGIDNSYMATSRMNVARWYNAEPEDPLSSNALTQPVTEFSCQGLELDLPIVCWGEDLRWERDTWSLTPIRRKYRQDDPEALLRNTYRVLLTRGRDGTVIFIPDERFLDGTEVALLAAGVRLIPEPRVLAAEAAG